MSSPKINKRPSAKMAYAMLALAMAFWASNSIIGRAIKDQIGPFSLAVIRWSGALILIAPLSAHRVWEERREILHAWKATLILGLLGIACYNTFLYAGLHLTTATNALLIQALVPGIVLMLEMVLFRNRPRTVQLIAVGTSAVGVAVIVTQGQIMKLMETQFNRGDLLIVCAVICWAAYTVLLRFRPAIHPLSFLFATFAVGAIVMLPLAIFEQSSAPTHLNIETVAAAAYVAVFPSIVAFAMFNLAVEVLGSARASQTLNLMPVFGAGVATLVLGEQLNTSQFLGIGLVLVGVALPWMTESHSLRFVTPSDKE